MKIKDTVIVINDLNKIKLITIAVNIISDVNKYINCNFLEFNYNKTCCVSFLILKIKKFQINYDIKVHNLKHLEMEIWNFTNINCNYVHIKCSIKIYIKIPECNYWLIFVMGYSQWKVLKD